MLCKAKCPPLAKSTALVAVVSSCERFCRLLHVAPESARRSLSQGGAGWGFVLRNSEGFLNFRTPRASRPLPPRSPWPSRPVPPRSPWLPSFLPPGAPWAPHPLSPWSLWPPRPLPPWSQWAPALCRRGALGPPAGIAAVEPVPSHTQCVPIVKLSWPEHRDASKQRGRASHAWARWGRQSTTPGLPRG